MRARVATDCAQPNPYFSRTRVSAIVMHPDAMVDLAPYRRLGRRLCIENMDPRKQLGQTAGLHQFQGVFRRIPGRHQPESRPL